MRLIDADALVEECEEVCKRLEKLDDGIFCPAHYTLEGVRTIIHRIEKQPTRRADGTVEDGYWIKGYREWSSGRREDIYWCSQCKRINETKLTHCPYCGATMNADRKTENSSEIPNNSTISKMEQVDEPERNMAEDIVESFGFKAESYRQAKAKTEQTERSE